MQLIHICTQKKEKNWGNMTSCNQLKDNFLLLFFHLIIVYFVRERFYLSTGIYISMKSTFFKNLKAQKNGKNIKIYLTKTKQNKKNWRRTIKTITNEFECFDVRPQHCIFSSFYNKKQQELYYAFSTNIMLTIYIITNFHMLYYFDINTCIVTTVSGVSDTLTTLRLQLVMI